MEKKSTIGTYNPLQVSNMCLKMVTPKIAQALRRKTSSWFSGFGYKQDKLAFAKKAICELMDDPKCGMIKAIVTNAGLDHNDYHALAIKFKDVI